MTSRLPMLLRRGLLISPTLVVDSDPERPGGLADRGDVQVVVRDVITARREVHAFPARQLVPVLGVIAERTPRRSAAGDAIAACVGATA